MNIIILIAINTYREILRDKIFYSLIGFSVVVLGMSLALGQLTFAEQSRVSINFGFTAIHLAVMALSVLFASQLIHKEIQSKTIMPLLARPVSSLQFLMGKSLGLLLLSITMTFSFMVLLLFLVLGFDLDISLGFFIGFLGIALESALLICLCVLLSTVSRPVLVISYAIPIFLVGHWLGSLSYFIEKSGSQSYKLVAQAIRYIMPDLERFNWRSLFLYGDTIAMTEIASAGLYCVTWMGLCLLLATIIFNKRDLI